VNALAGFDRALGDWTGHDCPCAVCTDQRAWDVAFEWLALDGRDKLQWLRFHDDTERGAALRDALEMAERRRDLGAIGVEFDRRRNMT
jgi:hypothetical protein